MVKIKVTGECREKKKRRRTRGKELQWRWTNERIKEVKEFKYLEYICNADNDERLYLSELVKTANKVLGMV